MWAVWARDSVVRSNKLSARNQKTFARRNVGGNVWLSRSESRQRIDLNALKPRRLNYEVLESEESIGRAQLKEIQQAAREREGDLVITTPILARTKSHIHKPMFSVCPMASNIGFQ